MIIQGSVLTNEGPKTIEQIKSGDIVINLANRPCRVVKAENGNVTEAICFTNNPDLLIGNGTDVATRYGRAKNSEMQFPQNEEMLYQCEAPCFYDTLTVKQLDAPRQGYELTIDSGNGVFVNGYGIYVKEAVND